MVRGHPFMGSFNGWLSACYLGCEHIKKAQAGVSFFFLSYDHTVASSSPSSKHTTQQKKHTYTPLHFTPTPPFLPLQALSTQVKVILSRFQVFTFPRLSSQVSKFRFPRTATSMQTGFYFLKSPIHPGARVEQSLIPQAQFLSLGPILDEVSKKWPLISTPFDFKSWSHYQPTLYSPTSIPIKSKKEREAKERMRERHVTSSNSNSLITVGRKKTESSQRSQRSRQHRPPTTPICPNSPPLFQRKREKKTSEAWEKVPYFISKFHVVMPSQWVVRKVKEQETKNNPQR